MKKPLHWISTLIQSVLVAATLPAFVAMLSACASSGSKTPSNRYQTDAETRPRVDEKYSLAADRQAFDEIRSQEPREKKKENDELAFMINLFGDGTKDPSGIRDKFNSLVSKKRELFDRDINKERDKFSNDERKAREAFLKDQDKTRDAYRNEKHTRDESTEFFKDQNDKRQEFFSNEREKRNDFESDVRERRKDFEDYIHEKQNDFGQRFREYTQRYQEQERLKQSALKSGP